MDSLKVDIKTQPGEKEIKNGDYMHATFQGGKFWSTPQVCQKSEQHLQGTRYVHSTREVQDEP